MKHKLFFILLFLSFHSFGQSGYIFKDNGMQITFPKKPLIDTTVVTQELKVRFIVSKDSLSNYYLSFTENTSGNLLNELDDSSISDFMDGLMDSQKNKYKAEIISKKEFKINEIKVGEYYMKGLLGQNQVFIKSWVCLKNQKAIVCQHLYLIQNEAAITLKQQTFFQSLIL